MTAFITLFGAYAYKTMSFGLKNARVTYQLAIQLCFTNQLHRNMEAPASIKDIQKFIGCMAALNRFFSMLGERGLPFFKLLKKQDKFRWSQEAAGALKELKQHLQSPPILMAPMPGVELLHYIAATTHFVSTTNCGRTQRKTARLRRPAPCLLHQRSTL